MMMSLSQAQTLATDLMREFGIAQQGWQFKFNNAKRRLGVCKFRRNRLTGEVKPGTIELSRYLVILNDFAHVDNTIRHEIAHALTPGHHHDRVWRAMAQKCGASPERCSSTANMPKGDWVAVCPGCDTEHTMHRKPKYVDRYSCRACGHDRGQLKFEKVAVAA